MPYVSSFLPAFMLLRFGTDDLIPFFVLGSRLQELLQRYNPTVGMSEEERVRLTARRVGLDVPITHDASSPGSSNNYRESAQIAQNQYKQDKDQREDQLYSGKGDGINVGGPLRPPLAKE